MSQDLIPYLREVRSQITRADEAADEITSLRATIKRFKEGVAILTYQNAQNGADAMNLRNLARRLLDGETLSLASTAVNGGAA